MLTEQQLEYRRTGITATDISAIVRKNPWRAPIDVWRDKTGNSAPIDDTVRSVWGQRLEPMLRADYEQRHEVRVEVPGTLAHPDRPWQLATPDGLAFRGSALIADNGLEIKVHGPDARFVPGMTYGAPGTDEIPVWELLQDLWNIDVAGIDRWDHIAFDGAPTEYIVMRDDELLGILREHAERFMRDYVLTNTPPPPDGSESYDSWISHRFKARNTDADLISIDDNVELMGDVAQLRATRSQLAELERLEKRLEQTIKLAIGDAAGVSWANGKKRDAITYKQPKDSLDTDWQKVATEQRQIAALVMSAKKGEIARSLTALDVLAETAFANSRATIRGCEIVDTIKAMSEALAELASDHRITVNTKAVPNSRRMLCPRTWKES
jgi:predicted phage-related endonuclease